MESIIERNKRIGADVKRAHFMVKQQQPYDFKKRYAAIRAREFVGMCDEHNKNYHVSVGGLDSITLFLFLHSIGIRSAFGVRVFQPLILRIEGIKPYIKRLELFL